MMNLGSIASGLFFITLLCPSNVESYECSDSSFANGSMHSFPNPIFSNLKISRLEDLEYRTQLHITVNPTEEFFGSSCKVILSSTDDGCVHYSEQTFEESVYIPDLDRPVEDLKPGCNYSLVFIVHNSCIQTYYQIPEKKPCAHFSPEDTFDSFPNRIMDNVTVNAFKKNAVRLNISFSAKPEYANVGGVIALSSKNKKCDHHEEFSFNLSDENLVIPRVEYPHSFIDIGCEYMVDFEMDNGYCLTTTYTVPDMCAGFEPKSAITDVVKIEKDKYKVTWNSGINETYPITDIVFSVEDVPAGVFNSHMVIEDRLISDFTVLNLSRLSEPGIYQLKAIFINEIECTNESSFEFEIKGDPGVFIFILVSTIIIFTIVPAICLCIPTLRTKIVTAFKTLFGKTIVQIPVPTSVETKYLNLRKKELVNECYVPLELQQCDEFEYPLKYRKLELETDTEPKSGNFGIVYIGRAYGINKIKGYTTVAVKQLKDNAPEEDVQALKDEISTLRKIAAHGNHENVVKMLACCSIEKPYMILLEFVACGDLKNYLIDLRDEWLIRKKNRRFVFPGDDNNGSYISPNARTISETSSSLPSPTETESTIIYEDTDDCLLSPPASTPTKITPALSNVELQKFALQIARGMAFLESISVVHRDLAARNVLISEAKILKISDFGMSRIGDYVHRNTGQQPLRWMAPESIEKFTCTSRSDVWSFGVVLWEIGTLGAFPYDSISNECILEYLLYSLKKGIRLMRPEICTDELYSLMLKCWSENPDDRPNFQQIVDYLSGEKKKIYIDFQKLNPAYVFPPTKQT